MITVNEIRTVAVEVINIKTGEKLEPVYEAYGFEKFQEFVAWYQENLTADSVAYIRGIGYEESHPVCLATEFVGVREMATL
jgi:hypothetical protein